MSATEDAVVDLLTETIEHRYVVVGILGCTVTLHGLILHGYGIQLVKKVRLHNIIGIKYDNRLVLMVVGRIW